MKMWLVRIVSKVYGWGSLWIGKILIKGCAILLQEPFLMAQKLPSRLKIWNWLSRWIDSILRWLWKGGMIYIFYTGWIHKKVQGTSECLALE